jgi:hypothetical protein
MAETKTAPVKPETKEESTQCCEPECGPVTCEPGTQAVEPKAAEQPRKANKPSGGCDGSCS